MKATREEEFRAYVVGARAGLLRTATWLTAGDSHLAEDLVQITLTRLYVAWPRIRRTDGPDGYARRTLVNALIDERRRPFWRRESSHALVPDGAAPPSDGDHSQLRAALAELPPGMRAVVVFRYVYDLSVADTADALKCSEGNVKSQTARGLERLRELLPPLTEAAPREMPSGPAAESPRQPLNRPHLPTASLTIPRSSS